MSKHNWTEQKQIKILDVEKYMFNTIWEGYIQQQDKVSEKMVEDYIEYLSIQYQFNPKNFTVYDKEGNLIHRRVPRN